MDLLSNALHPHKHPFVSSTLTKTVINIYQNIVSPPENASCHPQPSSIHTREVFIVSRLHVYPSAVLSKQLVDIMFVSSYHFTIYTTLYGFYFKL